MQPNIILVFLPTTLHWTDVFFELCSVISRPFPSVITVNFRNPRWILIVEIVPSNMHNITLNGLWQCSAQLHWCITSSWSFIAFSLCLIRLKRECHFHREREWKGLYIQKCLSLILLSSLEFPKNQTQSHFCMFYHPSWWKGVSCLENNKDFSLLCPTVKIQICHSCRKTKTPTMSLAVINTNLACDFIPGPDREGKWVAKENGCD